MMIKKCDDLVLSNISDRVATLTFNQPKKLNALSPEMEFSAIEILKKWSLDPDIGAIVVTGSGGAFSVGGDISKMDKAGGGLLHGNTIEQNIDGLRREQELSWLLFTMPKVTIAAVNGHAMGAGMAIAMACDLRIASDKAKFGTAYAKVALGGDFGITWLLTQYVSAPKAKELLFLGENISAMEAQRIGLINRAISEENFAYEVQNIALRIAHGAQVSYRYMKENVNLSITSDFYEMLNREAESHLRCARTEDFKEGVQAFIEKRQAKFTGR